MNPFENSDDYSSSWDWSVERSQYHFDYTKKDQPGDWFQVLGRFVGDWSNELDLVAQNTKPITWATRKIYRDKYKVSNMLAQEEADLTVSGAPVDLQLTDINDYLEDMPMLMAMGDFFGLENIKRRVHYQLPGQMFNYHIDKLWDRCPEDPDRIVRITVNLTDWLPGQFVMYGTGLHSHWHAGDIHIFDWKNVPHATANASKAARPTLQLTGLKTDRTREILAVANENSIYNL